MRNITVAQASWRFYVERKGAKIFGNTIILFGFTYLGLLFVKPQGWASVVPVFLTLWFFGWLIKNFKLRYGIDRYARTAVSETGVGLFFERKSWVIPEDAVVVLIRGSHASAENYDGSIFYTPNLVSKGLVDKIFTEQGAGNPFVHLPVFGRDRYYFAGPEHFDCKKALQMAENIAEHLQVDLIDSTKL